MTTIDAKGKACPIPVVMAKKEIDAGQTAFAVLVDNPVAVENLTRLAESQGFSAASCEAGGIFTVSFSKTGSPAPKAAPADAQPASPGPRAGSWAVFVGRDVVGAGDPELGRSLMKMFFYTLSQSDDLPAAILFMNDGVRLPTLDGQVVEHLRALAEKGVEILVCGTCLNFYQLSEKLQIGTVSNMYDIVLRMQRAGKVVSL